MRQKGRPQINIRPTKLAEDELAWLQEQLGIDRTKVILLAVDRLYQVEIEKEKERGK